MKPPTKSESSYSWAQWTYSLGNLHPACFFFNLGGHSSVASQQCPLLLEETWYQLPDFSWCFNALKKKDLATMAPHGHAL